MRLLLSLGLVSLVSSLSLQVQQCGGDDDDDDNPSRLRVGAATVTLLPQVAGSTSYFDAYLETPLAMDPGDPGRDPGVFVEQWDVGTIGIGNGERSSHWVHDDIRATAVAFKDLDQPDGQTLVLVTADVYMMFRQDIQEVFDKVKLQVGEEAYSRLWIVISSTHNHMGPDTSGMSGMNHLYYQYLTGQIASAIVQSIDEETLEPAFLKASRSRYQFGMADSHAPYIADPTLHSLQAVANDGSGRVLATVVQWQNHPEDTLGFGEDVYATEAQAEYLRSIGDCISDDEEAHCHIDGQFISAGFPGYAVWHIMEETGAPAAYFSGPVGGLLAPLHAYVWETEGDQARPAGDGFELPEGAALIHKNFHKQAVNGLELGRRVLRDLEGAETITDPPISMKKIEFFTRVSNLGFRVGMSLKPGDQPLFLGHLKRELYTCPTTGPKNDTTCVSDGFASESDPFLKVPVRVGEYGKSEVHALEIGPVSIVTIPGEGTSELVEGLPADFVSDPRGLYFGSDENRANHVAAADYATGGYLRQAMPGTYRWSIGLAQDELGYMVPIADWRVFCTADDEMLEGQPGTCAALYAAGIMEFQDYDGGKWSMSGARCKAILDDPSVLEQSPYTDIPEGGTLAWQTCWYGQTFDQADGHYEETMSASWDFAADCLTAATSLLGWSAPLETTNPDFIGENLLGP